MASFVTKLEGHPNSTMSLQSVRVTYTGFCKDVQITKVGFLGHIETDLELDKIHPDLMNHLMEQAIQDSIENAGETVQT